MKISDALPDAELVLDARGDIDEDLFTDWFTRLNGAPLNTVIIIGWPEDNDYYMWQKTSVTSFEWTLLDATKNHAEFEDGYVETSDSNALDAGGDIEVGYIVKGAGA
jgi:hypothetical protein